MLVAGALLVAILAGTAVRLRTGDQGMYDDTIIRRYAAVLYPVAQQEVAESTKAAVDGINEPAEILVPVLLKSKEQEGMLGVAIFDPEGSIIQHTDTLLLPELVPGDYALLLSGEQISRYTADFPLKNNFAGMTGTAPVLEVLLPLRGSDGTKPIGFIAFYIDARKLSQELAAVDQRFERETTTAIVIGTALIAIVLAAGYWGLSRAERLIAERNDRLMRANFELTLAAKASALGQITSHLIHGMQGSVASLRAVVSNRPLEGVESGDWKSAADYTGRLQDMIQETVAILGDTEAQFSYLLKGKDLADTIRRRNAPAATDKGVALDVTGDFENGLDSYRGSLVCLIAANLVQNAIAATPPGRRVAVELRDSGGSITLLVADEGSGISDDVKPRLFEPGHSSRARGTGLGLAISQLLARQIGASLILVDTHSHGTIFRLTLPRQSQECIAGALDESGSSALCRDGPVKS